MSSSKKRPPPSVNGNGRQGTQPVLRRRVDQQKESDCFVKLLSEAGCRLSSDGPIQLSRELQQRLELRLARDSSLVGPFLAGFQSHIENGEDLHRFAVFSLFFTNLAELKGKDVSTISLKLLVNSGLESKCFNIDNNLYPSSTELFSLTSFNRQHSQLSRVRVYKGFLEESRVDPFLLQEQDVKQKTRELVVLQSVYCLSTSP